MDFRRVAICDCIIDCNIRLPCSLPIVSPLLIVRVLTKTTSNCSILNTMGRSLMNKLYLLLAWSTPIQGASISSFIYAPWGTQLILQNSTTGYITYSWCNSTGSLTPIYPTDPPLALDLPSTAKNGTSVASTGWSIWDNVVGHPAVTYVNKQPHPPFSLVRNTRQDPPFPHGLRRSSQLKKNRQTYST